jgi:hypothetical protein
VVLDRGCKGGMTETNKPERLGRVKSCKFMPSMIRNVEFDFIVNSRLQQKSR